VEREPKLRVTQTISRFRVGKAREQIDKTTQSAGDELEAAVFNPT
jgi:hypothetical protein